jgi:Zn-dependent M28 family amino/carboxypeptidase
MNLLLGLLRPVVFQKMELMSNFINNGANILSGVTTVRTELVKFFGRVKPTKEIILVVFFAAEESGLLGSFSFS